MGNRVLKGTPTRRRDERIEVAGESLFWRTRADLACRAIQGEELQLLGSRSVSYDFNVCLVFIDRIEKRRSANGFVLIYALSKTVIFVFFANCGSHVVPLSLVID